MVWKKNKQTNQPMNQPTNQPPKKNKKKNSQSTGFSPSNSTYKKGNCSYTALGTLTHSVTRPPCSRGETVCTTLFPGTACFLLSSSGCSPTHWPVRPRLSTFFAHFRKRMDPSTDISLLSHTEQQVVHTLLCRHWKGLTKGFQIFVQMLTIWIMF